MNTYDFVIGITLCLLLIAVSCVCIYTGCYLATCIMNRPKKEEKKEDPADPYLIGKIPNLYKYFSDSDIEKYQYNQFTIKNLERDDVLNYINSFRHYEGWNIEVDVADENEVIIKASNIENGEFIDIVWTENDKDLVVAYYCYSCV